MDWFDSAVKGTALVGAAVALWRIIDDARLRQDQRLREFRLKLYEEQRPLYGEACRLTSEIATIPETLPQQQKFWQLYYGEMCLVEDEQVSEAMVAFGDALEQGCRDGPELQKLALKLSRACRRSLDVSGIFQVDLGKLTKKQDEENESQNNPPA